MAWMNNHIPQKTIDMIIYLTSNYDWFLLVKRVRWWSHNQLFELELSCLAVTNTCLILTRLLHMGNDREISFDVGHIDVPCTSWLTLINFKPLQIAKLVGQHVSHLGPVGPRWDPCWPHKPCYQGFFWNHSTIPCICWKIICFQKRRNKSIDPQIGRAKGPWFCTYKPGWPMLLVT